MRVTGQPPDPGGILTKFEDDVAVAALALRRLLDPHLGRTLRGDGDQWLQPNLLALASLALQELTRADECEGEIVYKAFRGGVHPLVRLTKNGASLEVDMAADRFGQELVRVAGDGRLYPDAPDALPFMSSDSYNAIYEEAAGVVHRAGLVLDAFPFPPR